MSYFFIYKTRDENNVITSIGISPTYSTKEEMYENMEFQRLCGFEVNPKVRVLGDEEDI